MYQKYIDMGVRKIRVSNPIQGQNVALASSVTLKGMPPNSVIKMNTI